jgi:hypothetical protein
MLKFLCLWFFCLSFSKRVYDTYDRWIIHFTRIVIGE